MADHDHVGPADEGFKPYRTEPGQRFGYTTAEGDQKEIVADPGGLALARNAEEEAVLASFDLPHGHLTDRDRARDSATVRKLTADTTPADKGKGE